MLRTLLLASLLAAPAHARRKPPAPSVEEGAAQLLGQALQSREAWEELAFLCDRIGHRLAGTAALEQALDWGLERMAEDGLQVHGEPVTIPVWIRGEELVEITEPLPRRLDAMILGRSVGTPAGGLEGEILVVGSFEELQERAEEVPGRIVVYDLPWVDYGHNVQFRGRGAIEAARHGAIAALVRSAGPDGLNTPHTGAMRYEEGVPPIPGVAVTAEDSAAMRRLSEAGTPVRVRLQLGAHTAEDATSRNAVGELTGRELPEQVVLLGCHMDSWDAGQGAQDDGAGCVTVMQAGALLAQLPTPPRRSVRVVLFTDEELGIVGGKAYGQAHTQEISSIVAALEADTGAGQPLGFRLDIRDPETDERDESAEERLRGILEPHLPLLAPVGAATLESSWSGADIWPLVQAGVPGFGLKHDTSGYWPVHHTRADTLDKIQPELLARNVAAMTLMTWILAELPEDLLRE